MLRSLHIRDYALIEQLEIEFDSGLNIITGETGAGKSIIVGALKMILGERASTDVIRTGAHKAVLEGVFDAPDAPKIRATMEANGYEWHEILILRREITSSYSRGFINDAPATMQLMREVASHVIDLHGQHEHQSLLRVETHLEMVDNFGMLGGLVEAYRKSYDLMDALIRKRRELMTREKELRQQKDLIEFQIQEIDRISPQAGEEEALEAERVILENAEKLYEATSNLYYLLYESEQAVYDQIVIARNELSDLARIDGVFTEALGEVKSAEIIVSELTKFIQDYNARIEFNPERLEAIRGRMGELQLLKKKYGATLEDVLAHRAQIGETYDLAADFEGAIAKVDKEIFEMRARLSEAAQRLSAKRHEVAERIEQGIEGELVSLGIANAKFEVRFSQQMESRGWVQLPVAGKPPIGVAAFLNGMDIIEFYVSLNVGETARPLAKTASGGEISRIMLALKTILAKSERLPILVFDEIDTGVSGRIAGRIGDSMRSLGQYHQIIAITHLPQIAAVGDVHYVVEKQIISAKDNNNETHERTRTQMRKLTDEERVFAVAALISGDEVTDAALENARQLLKRT
jgi:DNA repair protein RecN (Recombination protein N)